MLDEAQLAKILHDATYSSGRAIAPPFDLVDYFERERWLAVARAAIKATAKGDAAPGSIGLRDHFAAQALAGFCASPKVDIDWLRDNCVPSCYQLADRMLKERSE